MSGVPGIRSSFRTTGQEDNKQLGSEWSSIRFQDFVPTNRELGELVMMFDNRYQVVLADTASSKAINFDLRYRVYCQEKGYENPDLFREQLEYDEHDNHAVHFLVKDKVQDQWIAAARLVIGVPDTLPVSKVAKFDLPDLAPETLIAEFSRFLIIQDSRGAQGNGNYEPEVLLGLVRAAREYCRQTGIAHWVFLCRRAFSRMLANVGIGVEAIGPACVFRGVRIPYKMDLQTAFNNVPKFSFRTHQMLGRPWKSFIPYSDYCTRSEIEPILENRSAA